MPHQEDDSSPSDDSDVGRVRQLEEAFRISAELSDAGSETRRRALEQYADLRELLEPLLCPTADDDESREVIGEFEVLREIGRGGMGIVFEARQTTLGRRVALKVLPSRFAMCDNSVARFVREARLAARLAHRNVVSVIDAGTAQGVHYIAMEFVDGVPLNRIRRRTMESGLAAASGQTIGAAIDELMGADATEIELAERWPKGYVHTVVDFVAQIADALDHAHKHGVIHRDVKPANVLVRRDGRALLSDFGLAREDGLPSMTRTGDFAGTPYYASPEQATSRREVDHRTDIYSLGVTLYELLTASRPFDGETTPEVMQRILGREPLDPAQLNPQLAPDLVAVVLKAMEKDPSDRYQTAAEFAADLRAFLEYRPVLARRASRWVQMRRWVRREKLKAAFAATLSAMLLVGIVLTVWLLSERHAALERFELLADAVRLRDAIRAEAQLLPAWPDRADAMAAWLEEQARPLVDKLPTLRAALEDLDEAGGDRVTGFSSRFVREQMTALIADLTAFADPQTGVVARVRAHLAWARTVRERSITSRSEEWKRARRAIAASEKYGGLQLSPQMGLVPIGEHPTTRLWEFAHLRSGAGGTGIVFVLIPGGTFFMGSQSGDSASSNFYKGAEDKEQPRHRITLDPFFLAKHELTQGQWMELSHEPNPSLYRVGERPRGAREITDRNPVEQVTWDAADRLMRSHGLSLPTEAQWEYACRAGTTSPWFTGENVESIDGYANVKDRSVAKYTNWRYDEFLDDGHVVHAPVGSFRPNQWGLYDMLGNVWEWCRDFEAPYTVPARSHDGLRLAASGEKRVDRGGSYGEFAVFCRCAERYGAEPDFGNSKLGLRPARRLVE